MWAGEPYQVVARLFYRDASRLQLDGLFGFTVNLEWTRRYYFPDFTEQVVKADSSAEGLMLLVVDDQGRTAAGTWPTGDQRSLDRRTFPLMFFDPLLLIARTRTVFPQRIWTVEAAPSGDSSLASAMRAANRLLILGGAAAAILILGLALTVRAIRANVEVAEMRSEFVSSVSHELKGPLATIRAAGQTLVAGRVPDDSTRVEYAQLIVQGAKTLNRLVDNLLAVSRATDIATTYLFEPLNSDVLVQEALQRFNLQLTSAGFDVTVDVPHDLPPVMVDRDALVLLLDNLLDNAIRHVTNDRRLSVRGRASGDSVFLRSCHSKVLSRPERCTGRHGPRSGDSQAHRRRSPRNPHDRERRRRGDNGHDWASPGSSGGG
jgi:signal transduction histidine kinase